MSGDAEYYDSRYGGGEHIELGWKEGCKYLGRNVFIQKTCAMAVIKRGAFFRSKIAKDFNICVFYEAKKMDEIGKRIFRTKKIDDWKVLVQRWDPVGSKKSWSRTLRPVGKKIFKRSIVHPRQKIKTKEVYERLLAGLDAYKIWYGKNNPAVDVEFETKDHKKRLLELKRLEALMVGKGKKKGKKDKTKKNSQDGADNKEEKKMSDAEKILAEKKKNKPKYL